MKSRRCTVRVNCQTLNDTKNFEMSASGVIIGAPNIFSHVLYFNLVAVRVLWRPWPEIEEVFLIPLPAYLHIWSSSNLQVERIVLVPNLNYGLQFPTHCYKDGEKSKQNHNNKLYGLQNYLNFGSNWLFLSSFFFVTPQQAGVFGAPPIHKKRTVDYSLRCNLVNCNFFSVFTACPAMLVWTDYIPILRSPRDSGTLPLWCDKKKGVNSQMCPNQDIYQ